MSTHHASIRWERHPVRDGYSRNHTWALGEGLEVPASAAPSIVPPPFSDARRLDPEAAFVGSVASCHMLWFLWVAHARGYPTRRYIDNAAGILASDDAGVTRVTRIDLSPQTRFEGKAPSIEVLNDMHAQAHERCFIASSINSTITIHPTLEAQDV